jgi:hypothetical protein
MTQRTLHVSSNYFILLQLLSRHFYRTTQLRTEECWTGTACNRGISQDGCLLGCCAVYSDRSLPTLQKWLLLPSSGRWVMSYRPHDGGSKHLWNAHKLVPDYTAHHPRRQPSFFLKFPWIFRTLPAATRSVYGVETGHKSRKWGLHFKKKLSARTSH